MSEISLSQPFPLPSGAVGVFTARVDGNLSLAAGLGHETGLATRERLCRALRLRWLCAAPQVHGTDVRRVTTQLHDGGMPVAEPADGHATALSEVGVMVLAADCVPVLLCCGAAVAAVHAGWRGLADGVLEEGVVSVRELGGEGATPHAVVGPCAGVCCYEVGADVLDSFAADLCERPPRRDAADLRDRPPRRDAIGKAKLDLRRIVETRLRRAGVRSVQHLEICTICDERLFSHRREGAAAGRQGAIAWLP